MNKITFDNKSCEHEFVYSHKDYEGETGTGTNLKEIDVVICKKCGELRRN